METCDINIRKAQLEDMDDIFWLLHSESIPWSIEQISADMNTLYVMSCENKLIGVSCCDLKGNRTEFLWTAIHAMYPEKALCGIMQNAIINVGFKRHHCIMKPCSADWSA